MKTILKLAVVVGALSLLVPEASAVLGVRRRTAVVVASATHSKDAAAMAQSQQAAAASQQQAAAANQQAAAANQQAAIATQQAATAEQKAATAEQKAATAEKEAAAAKQQAAAPVVLAAPPVAAPPVVVPVVAAPPAAVPVVAAPAAAAGTPLPIGTVVATLPPGSVATPIGAEQYYYSGGNFYRAVFQGNTLVYVTAQPK